MKPVLLPRVVVLHIAEVEVDGSVAEQEGLIAERGAAEAAPHVRFAEPILKPKT
jgi:hypothetical protein